MSSKSPKPEKRRPKTPTSRPVTPVGSLIAFRPEEGGKNLMVLIPRNILAVLTAYLDAVDVCHLWSSSKIIQQMFEPSLDAPCSSSSTDHPNDNQPIKIEKNGDLVLNLKWTRPQALPWPKEMMKRFSSLHTLIVSIEVPREIKASLEGFDLAYLPKGLRCISLNFPGALTAFILSDPNSPVLPPHGHSPKVIYFDFKTNLPLLESLSLVGEASSKLQMDDHFPLCLPPKLTHLGLSPLLNLTETFVKNLPSSLLSFSNYYHIQKHEDPFTDWRQNFPPKLTNLALRSPIPDVWKFIPKDTLTSLDVSFSDVAIDSANWKELPRSLTYLGIFEFSPHVGGDIKFLPSGITHLHVENQVELTPEMAQQLPKKCTLITSSQKVVVSPDSFQYLNADFQRILLAPPLVKDKTVGKFPPHLRQLEIRGDYQFDTTKDPLPLLHTLVLEKWLYIPPENQVFNFPRNLTKLRIDSSCLPFNFANLASLPRSLLELSITIDRVPPQISFEALPQSLTHLDIEFVAAKKKGFSIAASKPKLSKNLPPNLSVLKVRGTYKLFTNDWLEGLPQDLSDLEIRAKDYNSTPAKDSDQCSLTSACFLILPRKLKRLFISINDVLTDNLLSNVPRSITDLTIESGTQQHSILTEFYYKSLPPFTCKLVLPQSSSIEYIPTYPPFHQIKKK